MVVGAAGQCGSQGSSATRPLPTATAPCPSADVSGYSSSLQEALVPLVADHKCSSPEVYGADISPNMLCAGYFDCKSDACQVSPASDLRPGQRDPDPQRQQGPRKRAHHPPPRPPPLLEGPIVGRGDTLSHRWAD